MVQPQQESITFLKSSLEPATSVTQGCSWDLEFCAVDLGRAYSYLKHVQGGVSCWDETLNHGRIPVPTGQAF